MTASSSYHCPRCGKLKLTPTGKPHLCRAEETERLRKIEEALEFYSNPHNYGIGGGSSEHIHKDGGRLARVALRALPNNVLASTELMNTRKP